MVREKVIKLAARVLQVPEDQVELVDGKAQVKGQTDTIHLVGRAGIQIEPEPRHDRARG